MEEKVKRIEVVIYIILVLVIINTIALFVSLKDKESEEQVTITQEETEYDVSMFKTIDTNAFIDAYNGSELQVVYFGRSTCGYCVKMLPVLQQAQKEYGYKTLYVDITTVDSASQEKIKALDTFFDENYGRTPMIVLVKEGKIVDKQMGYTEYSSFAQLLENNGYNK